LHSSKSAAGQKRSEARHRNSGKNQLSAIGSVTSAKPILPPSRKQECNMIAFIIAAAIAAAPEPTIVETISYADLDLRSPSDRQRLKDRISFAAYRLCLADSSASPSPAVADPDCFRMTMSIALGQMDRAVAALSDRAKLASTR
jgi:UrcA family protein